MKVIPAIDLLAGNVVRLIKGDETRVLQYSDDPIMVAKLWLNEGARMIHVVDLDAAIGIGKNRDIILGLANRLEAKFQVGGGIRTLEKARYLLDNGIYRIVLGTMAITNPELIKQLIEEYGWERVAVALDYSRGKLKLRGWKKATRFKVIPMISKFRRIGCRYLILTSIDKDGTLSGPDVELLAKVAKLGNIIAAGGVRNISDILKLKGIGIYGLILGRALYEGRIRLKEAIKVAGDAS